MPKLIGIDGCPGGWFAITLNTETRDLNAEIVHNLTDFIVRTSPQIVAIDIPIGLTDSGPRKCDVQARKLLQTRSSCVFSAPIRPALSARTRNDADSISRAIQGKGVAAQACGIYRKVEEVDILLQTHPHLRSSIFEIHPELSFRAWNNHQTILHPKKSLSGHQARLSLVDQVYGSNPFFEYRRTHFKKQLADDDILDAFAALWSAERIFKNIHDCCPNPPEQDSTGLPMTINF